MADDRQASGSLPVASHPWPPFTPVVGQLSTSNMVAPGLSLQGRSSWPAATAHSGPAPTVNYDALKHLKWSPRKQPERAAEVSRCIRDVVDRTTLSRVLQRPAPSYEQFAQFAKAAGVPDAQLHAAHQVALVEWWDMNTALYYLLAPAFILDGPLMRSDTVFIEQHFVKQQWRDGKGLYNWLMLFGTDDTVPDLPRLYTRQAPGFEG